MDLIGLKFCGGCNPVIDRSALVQEIRKLLPPGCKLVTGHSAALYERAVLVCGCPTACADKPDLRRLAKRWIVISGPMVDLEAVPEDKMVEVIIRKLNI
ncbi:MAG: hypothetical protein ABSE95_14695 [Thermodesulfobacteriota bacterium]|jgi:3-hydroxyacyl-[acyl-carrier-protein] dehydratase